MAKFDQRGQQVSNQVNAEDIGLVKFGTVQNKTELVAELQNLLSEIDKATQTSLIKEHLALNVESHIKKAILEIEKPEPNKKSVLDDLEGAKGLLDGITSATSLITSLIQAAKTARGIFL